nr:uncharacterized protein LOC117352159 isoform X2 [Geotrypetes seraphini]
MMVRAFGDEACAQNTTGVLKRYIEAEGVFCYKRNVLKGVFQVSIAEKYNLMLEDGEKVCQGLNATFATEVQLTDAFEAGYETCRTGWVKEGKNLLPRRTSNPKCANGKIGIVAVKAMDGFSDVFCFRNELINSTIYSAFPALKTKINYTEATDLCSSFRDLLAVREQIQAENIFASVPRGSTTIWYQNGIAAIKDQTLDLQPRLNDVNITAPVYCYDPLARDYIPYIKEKIVASGVYQVEDTLVNYRNADGICRRRNATLANLAQVKAAYDNKYQTCKWSWVQNETLVMVRLYSDELCGNFQLGVLQLPPCDNFKETRAICIDRNAKNVNLYIIYHPNQTDITHTEASDICLNHGYSIASKAEIESHWLPQGTKGWCQEGIAQTRNKTTDLLCVNYMNFTAPVYCYDPQVPDQFRTEYKEDTTWRKITMCCILAGIFVILLCAALFMKGNQFKCCHDDKHSTSNETVQSNTSYILPTPTWNTTGSYQPMKEVLDPKYHNLYRSSIKNRLPVIQPATLDDKSRGYDNLSYITADEE